MRLTFKHVLFVTGLAFHHVPAQAAPNPPQQIPGGVVTSEAIHRGNGISIVEELKVGSSTFRAESPDITESKVSLNGKPLISVEGALDFTGVWRTGAKAYVVIAESVNGGANPPDYQIVELSPSGVILSKDLGPSGETPKVALVGEALQLSMIRADVSPDRTILFNDGVATERKASFGRPHFDADDCVAPRREKWQVSDRPDTGGNVVDVDRYYGLYVVTQRPGWTALATAQRTGEVIGWMRTALLVELAVRNCAQNPS